jgi:hypothetical protein
MKLITWLVNQYYFIRNKYYFYYPKSWAQEDITPQVVSTRFRKLFVDHGVEVTQIPRLFDEITLDDLKTDNSLLKKLTPEVIDKAAKFFNVQSDWLEGLTDVIYEHRSFYKRPELFFQYLSEIKYDEWDFPLRIITTTDGDFDINDPGRQPFTVLFVENVAELGEEDVCRYYLETGWSWQHDSCRIQIKALAMLYWQKKRTPITIYKVPRKIYFQIEELQAIPHRHLTGPLISNPSLEDYVITPEESPVSKESAELPYVIRYIEENELQDLVIHKSTLGSTNIDKDSDTSIRAAKGAAAKHYSAAMLKQRFMDEYARKIKSNLMPARGAAFEFYDSLNEDEELALARSPKDYDKSSPDERRLNGVKTLTTHYREHKHEI